MGLLSRRRASSGHERRAEGKSGCDLSWKMISSIVVQVGARERGDLCLSCLFCGGRI